MKELEADKKQNQDCDVRHRARITDAQKKHAEELKKLEQSLKKKQGKKNKKDEYEKDEVTPSQTSGNQTNKKNAEINVSRKKSIFKIFTENFVIAVNPSNWKKIISALKSLFKSSDQTAEIIKKNNKIISSFLSKLRNKDLEQEIKIAALLRQISQNASALPIMHLNRMLAIQLELIKEVRGMQKSVSQMHILEQSRIAALAAEKQNAKEIEKQKLEQKLNKISGVDDIRQDISRALKTQSDSSVGQFRAQDLSQQQNYYVYKSNYLQKNNTIPEAVGKPILHIVDIAKLTAEKLVISPIKFAIKEIKAEFLHLLDKSIGVKSPTENCNNYKQANQDNMHHGHHHKHRHIHGHGCGCCKNDHSYKIEINIRKESHIVHTSTDQIRRVDSVSEQINILSFS